MKKNLFVLLLLLLSNIPEAQAGFERVRAEYESLLDKKFVLLPHKGVYLLPASYNETPNKESYKGFTSRADFADRGEYNRKLETEFQVSFLVLAGRNLFKSKFNLFVGYTQRSWWQLYNEKWSRQFRETNYTPEVFTRRLFSKPKKLATINFIGYDFGFVHQSNGQTQELSRSWNRVFSRLIFTWGDTFFITSLWYRLPERNQPDQNPGMGDFVGHGEFLVKRTFGRSIVELRLLTGTRKLGAELSHSYPLSEGLSTYFKISSGYGLSLIDYNQETQRIGIGVSLTDIFARIKN
jgi:phospholipase A1